MFLPLSFRLKLDWCTEEEASHVKGLLHNAMPDAQLVLAPEDETSPPPKRARLFTFMKSKPKSAPTDSNSELTLYLDEPPLSESNPLHYWQSHVSSYPRLAGLAEKYLGVVPSSAAVERTFSTAGKVFRPDRCRMTNDHFETIMMIKCNYDKV